MARMGFLRGVLSGRKKLIKMTEVNFLPKVERFRSLTIEKMLAYCTDNIEGIFDYLPDDPSENTVDRTYLLNVNFLINIDYEHCEPEMHPEAEAGGHHSE